MIHTRTMDLRAYRRSDGLYDIEGHIIDVKPFTHNFTDTYRAAGEPVHDMWLRLTVDRALVVQAAEAKFDVGAHAYCAGVEPNFAELAGLRIAPGWNRGVRQRVGHGLGCTHLVEMLAQMATAAMQALDGQGIEVRALGPGPGRASALKMCYAGLTKGTFTLHTAVLLAAHRLGLESELRSELEYSQAKVLERMTAIVPWLAADAGRWIGEMEEIAETFAGVGLTPDFHRAAAQVFALRDATPLAAETRESRAAERRLEDAIAIYAKALDEPDAPGT